MWALKIEEGSVAGAGSLNWFVQSWEALEKLWRVAVPHFPLFSAGSLLAAMLHDIITQARDSRQHCHVQRLSNPPLKNS